MKRILIVLALVAMVIMPVAARGNFSVGLEAGQPSGVTFGYQINDKIDGYVTGAFGFGSTSYIDAVAGAQYKVTSFSIKGVDFDVLAGAQIGALFYLGDASGVALTARATGTVAYNWTWEKVGDFTAYLRAGIGARFGLSGEAKTGLSWNAALGCVYHF